MSPSAPWPQSTQPRQIERVINRVIFDKRRDAEEEIPGQLVRHRIGADHGRRRRASTPGPFHASGFSALDGGIGAAAGSPAANTRAVDWSRRELP
jgi:hypothetical protein